MPCGTPVAGNTVGGSVGVSVFLNINRSRNGLLFRVTGFVLFTSMKPFKRSLGTELALKYIVGLDQLQWTVAQGTV